MDPIIVIGAPRSGTKMLRELLKLHPNVAGALHEEERIWSYGNTDRLSKSLQAEDASLKTKKYIRNHYKKEEIKYSGKRIVAKNVANTLRIKYIKEIFPDSPIINIFRDGRDAAFSAKQRWKNPIDTKYMIKNKIFIEKNLPIREIPFFIKRQIKWAFNKNKHKKDHLAWWGPKFDDFEELIQEHSLIELCGIQWSRCVESTLNELSSLKEDTYININYEELVLNPEKTMRELFTFLGLSLDDSTKETIRKYVNPSSIGKWEKNSNQDEYKLLMNTIEPTLRKINYST